MLTNGRSGGRILGGGGGFRMRRSLGQAGATHMVFGGLLDGGLLFKVLYIYCI